MKILVTGAKGMVGTALVNNLKAIRDGKNKTRPSLHIEEIYEYDLGDEDKLDSYCESADFVFNLAGVNRPTNPEDFMKGNFGFASTLLETLKKHNNKAPIMLSSSIQATLSGRFGNSEYGRSKLAGEELFFNYGKKNSVKVAVYRFPNLMGHSKPKYNSAVSTFCYAVANDDFLATKKILDNGYPLTEQRFVQMDMRLVVAQAGNKIHDLLFDNLKGKYKTFSDFQILFEYFPNHRHLYLSNGFDRSQLDVTWEELSHVIDMAGN